MAVPWSGGSRVHRILTRVVLPAPLGPRSPKSSPFLMVRLRLSMALMVWVLWLNGLVLGVLNLYVFVRLIVWMVFSSFNRDALFVVLFSKNFGYLC